MGDPGFRYVNGVRLPDIGGLYYQQDGLPAGATLLLSSGLGGAAHYWEPNIPSLGENRRLLSYDHRGTGRSDRALGKSGTISGMADDVLLLLDALGVERTDFLGHALGALIGLEVATRHPDRLNKLIVVNGWALPDPVTQLCFETRLALLRNSGPEAYIRAQPLFLYPSVWLSENWPEIETELDAASIWFPPPHTVEQRVAAVRSFRLESDVTVPTLVVVAEDDLLIPASAGRRLAAKISGSNLAIMPWGGHACNVTDPDTFNRIVLDFLTE